MSAGANMYDQIKAFDEKSKAYGVAFNLWVETGVWWPPRVDKRNAGSLLPVGEFEKKVRECAARRNMPFVMVSEVTASSAPGGVVFMEVPRQNRTLKLVAPLIVLAEQVDRAPTYSAQLTNKYCLLHMLTSAYRFYFMQLKLQEYLSQAVTTQEWRNTMRLPAKVNR